MCYACRSDFTFAGAASKRDSDTWMSCLIARANAVHALGSAFGVDSLGGAAQGLWLGRIAHFMKIITLILLGLALNTMFVCAEDFHLVQTVAHDDPAPATNSIYVLLLPLHEGTNVYINPVVLKKFDGKEIGGIIEGAVKLGFLPRGSVLHVDPSPLMVPPPNAEEKILTDYCKKIGITVAVSLTQ